MLTTPATVQANRYIFISYARANKSFVEKLTSDFHHVGLEVWIDTVGLEAGTPDWDQAIRDAIKHAGLVLLIASPDSRRSPYVAGELLIAESLKRMVIPVWAEGDDWIDSIPLSLSRAQYVDCRGQRYATGLTSLIERMTGVPNAAPLVAESAAQEVHDSAPSNRIRRILLERVKNIWIRDVLEHSLHRAALIQLGKEDRSHLVAWTTTFRTYRGQETAYVLPEGTTITDIFDRLNCALLITGDPGSGKTTTLLDLAREKIRRAENNAAEPIPVVFNLSSWSGGKQSIAEWLASELNTKYQISRKVASELVDKQELMLLLDGLDEVRAEKRNACVEAINEFRGIYGETAIVVCCRISDYESLRGKLRLESAVYLQPLTGEQVEQYLVSLGSEMDALRNLLRSNSDLRELARTPLMLNIMAIAYQGAKVSDLAELESASAQRDLIFSVYIERMLSQRGTKPNYSHQQTIKWLTWLAQKLNQHGQTMFLPDALQMSYLDSGWQRVVHRLVTRFAVVLVAITAMLVTFAVTNVRSANGVLFGIVCGILGCIFVYLSAKGTISLSGRCGIQKWISKEFKSIAELINIDLPRELSISGPWGIATATLGTFLAIYENLNSNQGLPQLFVTTLNYWLTSGLTSAALVFIAANLLFPDDSFKMYELLRWNGAQATRVFAEGYRLTIPIVLACVLAGIGVSCIGGISIGIVTALSILALFMLLVGLFAGLMATEVDAKSVPNQGTMNSLKNGLTIGVFTGIVFFIGIFVVGNAMGVPDSALVLSLVVMLVSGAAMGGSYGIYAWLKHLNIMHLLYLTRRIPFNYVRFLDFAVDRILMQRVGGGYIFIHRLLLEYFSALQPESVNNR